jgi:Fis family transcriptional regulator
VERPSGSPEQILVVSYCDWFLRRIRTALAPAGYAVAHAPTPRELARHRRQRPCLLCFFDARGETPGDQLAECIRVRPGERYVLVLGPWQAAGKGVPSNLFGIMREPFGSPEVAAWATRASEEAGYLKGDRSLEEVLYARFRFFLQNLGPDPATALPDLVREQVDRPLIRAVLEWAGGNQTRAAEILGIHRNTLRGKIRSLGMDPSQFGAGRSSGT